MPSIEANLECRLRLELGGGLAWGTPAAEWQVTQLCCILYKTGGAAKGQ